MPEIFVNDMRDGYTAIARWVLDKGEVVAPRGLPTREVTNAMIHVADPYDTLPVGINRRGFSSKFAAAEAAQLIGGVSDVPLTLRINPNMTQFLDESLAKEGKVFHGAYGPRVRYGLQAAVERLMEDPDTRQGVISIFNHNQDLDRQWKDVPCTIALHLTIRDGQLLLATHMRSNDVWWGLAYDVFQFTQLQLTVANVLGLKAGTYTHVADSLHVYDKDVDGIRALQRAREFHLPDSLPRGFNGPTIVEAQDRARIVLIGNQPPRNPSEEWYLGRLHD